MKLATSDIAEMGLAAVAATLGGTLAVGLPFVGIPMAAVALGWLAYRRGSRASVLAALAAAVISAVIAQDWSVMVFTVPALLASGPGAAWILMRWPTLRTVAVLTAIMLAAGILLHTVLGWQEGRSFLAQMRFGVSQTNAIAVSVVKALGFTDMEAIEKAAEESARTAYLLWPVSFAYEYGLAAALAVPLLSRVGRALGHAVSRTPALADLDLSLHVVWPAIAGLALLAASAFYQQPEGLLWAAGANLLLLARAPLFLQGLADFAALYRKAKVGRVGRVFGFTILTISEFAIPSVSIVGLLDLFANLRRLPRGGTAGTPGLEGGSGSV